MLQISLINSKIMLKMMLFCRNQSLTANNTFNNYIYLSVYFTFFIAASNLLFVKSPSGEGWWSYSNTTPIIIVAMPPLKMRPIAKRRRYLIADGPMGDDRITNLPMDLLICILDRISITDAARTSILSKTWRNVWQTRIDVILTAPFIKQLLSRNHDTYIIEGAVSKILEAHKGPIVKFVLSSPDRVILQPCNESWFSLMSTKGVKHISMTSDFEAIFPINVLASHFFSCSELVQLRLINYELRAPPKFQGFRNLTLVYLARVTFRTNMSFGPQLNQLSLIKCGGIQHLAFQFTHHNKNLNKFELVRCNYIEYLWVIVNGKNSMYSKKECINLQRFLSSTPTIATLILNSFSLEFLDPKQAKLTRLKMAMVNMKTIVLYNVDFYNFRHISNMLCLVRSSPNLQSLKIAVGNKVKRSASAEIAAEQYFKSLNYKKMVLEQHYTVEIGGAENSKAEILFRKYIRASSPSLKRLFWHRRTIFAERIKEFEYN